MVILLGALAGCMTSSEKDRRYEGTVKRNDGGYITRPLTHKDFPKDFLKDKKKDNLREYNPPREYTPER